MKEEYKKMIRDGIRDSMNRKMEYYEKKRIMAMMNKSEIVGAESGNKIKNDDIIINKNMTK